MECNKEEATRAKALAEKKLQSKDFQGARKIALKAQQLYSDLENISQMLMVCEIHCSAEKKLLGAEMDWYGILQLEDTADEATIKKQYRKFALQLHPDKNKFPGAESAFKLVGEAQRVLLDREKRKMHDMKRKARQSTLGVRGATFSTASAAYQAPPKGNSYASNGMENNFRGNFAGFNSQYTNAPPPQTGHSNCHPTFWTVCPFCSVKFQYYREIVNKSISCQTCKKAFVAYEVTVSGVAPRINVDNLRFPKQEPFPKHGYSKVELGQKGASTAEIRRPEVPHKTAYQSAAASAYKVNNRKRRRGDDESSESTDSVNSTESEEEEEIMTEDGHFQANQCSEPIRRSTRQRQKVSYKDNFSDDDDDEAVVFPGRVKGNGQPLDKEEKKNSLQEEETSKRTRLDESDGSEESLLDDDSERDLDMEAEGEPDIYGNSFSDFNNFDKNRQEGCFSVGQIWAVKDPSKGMPRFYAQIRKVFTPGLKLNVTWLEPNPEKPDEIKWVIKKLPVSCGKFVLGKTEEISRSMLSHRMLFEQGIQNTRIINPNVGETWAVFKNWDIKWYCDPDDHKNYEYEFVEILSEYREKVGVQVAYLCKVKGFTSIFAQACRDGNSSFQIGAGELYRFAHRVPSFRLTGEEREGVPKGCFELDPSSIPLSIQEINLSNNNHDTVEGDVTAKGKSPQSDEKVTQVSSESETHSPPGSANAESIEIPDSDFHNFDDSKSQENFQTGQLWALYSEEDSLPKYYGQIAKIIPSPQFKLHVRWLTLCMLPEDVTGWKNKGMLNSCGAFKLKKCKQEIYTTTSIFSHRMKAEGHGKSSLFEILPNKGDIWALYRCWNCEMSCSDLKGCDYDLVEVIERNDSMVRVSYLERVDGFTSVFKCQLQGNSKVTQEIPMAEILRFSHQVPAVQLAEESNGSLRGCWDIDTAAMPVYFFRSK